MAGARARKNSTSTLDVESPREKAFLDSPLRDLGLSLDRTLLEECTQQLVKDLHKAGLPNLQPDFYLGLEYGVPSHSVSVSLLFMDAVTDPILLEVLRKNGERPCNRDEIMMCLRHESGHLFCYAYKLYEGDDFRRIFEVDGDFLDYPHWSRPWKADQQSRKYVKYLELRGLAPAHYAQKHPDDDFAETFAVWLDPTTHGSSRYAKEPSILAKLNHVTRAVGECGSNPPLVTAHSDRFSIRRTAMTLREYLNWE